MEPLTRDQWVRVIAVAEKHQDVDFARYMARLAREGLRLHDELVRLKVSA